MRTLESLPEDGLLVSSQAMEQGRSLIGSWTDRGTEGCSCPAGGIPGIQ